MRRRPKPSPGARDWRVQPLTPGRDAIAALADLRKLASAVRAGGEPVAATIEHWELTNIADYFEKVLRDTCTLMTPELDAAYAMISAACTEAEEEAAYEAWGRACDNANAMTTARRQGGTA